MAVKKKNPVVAVGLNFLIPGVGHMYFAKWGTGLAVILLLPVLVLLMPDAIFIVYAVAETALLFDIIQLNRTTRICPECGSRTKIKIEKCPHCGASQGDIKRPIHAAQSQSENNNIGK